jgi:hypothetical protein
MYGKITGYLKNMDRLPDIHFKHLNHVIFVKANVLDNISNSILEFCHITKHCQGIQSVNKCETIITKYVIYIDIRSEMKITNNVNHDSQK